MTDRYYRCLIGKANKQRKKYTNLIGSTIMGGTRTVLGVDFPEEETKGLPERLHVQCNNCGRETTITKHAINHYVSGRNFYPGCNGCGLKGARSPKWWYNIEHGIHQPRVVHVKQPSERVKKRLSCRGMAKYIGRSYLTIHNWKKNYPKLYRLLYLAIKYEESLERAEKVNNDI